MRRFTTRRVMLFCAGLGAWLGMLTGLVLALLVAGGAWLTVLAGGLLIGAGCGAMVGVLILWSDRQAS